MFFEWDENKNRINKAKHGIDFRVAATVFGDPHCASRIDRNSAQEERWQTIGVSEGVVLLFVSHTYQEGEEIVIRIISARLATLRERRLYEKGTF